MTSKLDPFPSGADIGAYVLDLGSFFVRAGNAGDDCPKHYSHSYVGEYINTSSSEDTDMATKSINGASVKKRYTFPVSFSSLRTNYEIHPCLYQPSKQSLSSTLPSLESLLAPVEPVQLDSNVFESLIDRIFSPSEETLKGKPIILSEPNKHNRSVRESMGEILFEKFETEAIYTAKAAVLTSFAVGRTGGLVINMGAHSTSLTPVIDGYTLQKNVMELPIGGNILDYQLSELLKILNLQSKITPIFSVKKDVRVVSNYPSTIEAVSSVSTEGCTPSFLMHSHREVLRWMREAIAQTSEDVLPLTMMNSIEYRSNVVECGPGVVKHGLHSDHRYYELPDGTSIDAEDISRKIPECLFNFEWILGRKALNESALPPSLLGETSLITACAHCIQSCDVDARRDLLSSVILSGGCLLTPGLSDRFVRQFQDVENIFGPGIKYKVISPVSTLERRFLQWIGASILASLASFQQMWMSRSEYNEHGIHLLERRCIQ